MTTRNRTPLLLAAALLLGAGAARAQTEIAESRATGPTGEVEIVNTAGSVAVLGWDRDEIRVSGTLGRGAERLAFEGGGERTVIRVVLPEGRRRDVRGSTLEVRVPAGKRVTVRTVSAAVKVARIAAEVAVGTTSGDVEVSGSPRQVAVSSTSGEVRVATGGSTRVRAGTTSGDVEVTGVVAEAVDVESVSGDLRVRATTPEVRATTVSGDLRMGGASERVAASTVSGDAEIRDTRVRYGSFETVSGNLTFEGTLVRGAAFSVQSHSGEIELILPRDVAMDLEVTTFSGRLVSDFAAAGAPAGGRPGREIRTTLGAGGALVTVKTFSGDVKLTRR